MRHIVMSSNRFYSAVSDYCLQFLKYLKNNSEVTFVSHAETYLKKNIEALDITWKVVPFWPRSLKNFVKTWLFLGALLKQERSQASQPQIFWVFEGHEHTLCALHRLLHPWLWRNALLIRVRGQAQEGKRSLFAWWVYRFLTDGVVFVANIVRKRMPFALPEHKTCVFPYCAEEKFQKSEHPDAAKSVTLSQLGLDSLPFFLVVGRFDPVKGHRELLAAFAQSRFSYPVALVFLGKSCNVKALDLAEEARKLLESSVEEPYPQVFVVRTKEKSVMIVDSFIQEAPLFIQKAAWGIIPSLGSEVICRVAVEFLFAGTPYVGTDAGAISEVCSLVPIVSLEPEESYIERMARALEEAFLLYTHQPARYHDLRQQCQSFAQKRYALSCYAALVSWAQSLLRDNKAPTKN